MKQIHDKLTIITRRDLSPGYQAVQSGHAAIQFQYEHPIISKNWYENSNYLIFLTTSDESELIRYLEKAKAKGIHTSVFQEPDIDNEITAIALEPSDTTRRLVSNLPLALKENVGLAQRSEQAPLKRSVPGSNPGSRTNQIL